MALETSSRKPTRRICNLCCLICGLLVIGCMERVKVDVYERPEPPAAPPVQKPPPPVEEPFNAQAQAAAALVSQGRQYLRRGDADAAIRVLERSVALDSNQGENYYYLAEAWLMKQNARQAREFNRLAEMHLVRDPNWQVKIARQRDRIEEFDR